MPAGSRRRSPRSRLSACARRVRGASKWSSPRAARSRGASFSRRRVGRVVGAAHHGPGTEQLGGPLRLAEGEGELGNHARRQREQRHVLRGDRLRGTTGRPARGRRAGRRRRWRSARPWPPPWPPGGRAPGARDRTARGPPQPRACSGRAASMSPHPTSNAAHHAAAMPRSMGDPSDSTAALAVRGQLTGPDQVAPPGGDLGELELDLGQVLAVTRAQRAGCPASVYASAAPSRSPSSIADVADGPQRGRQPPALAERAEPVHRLGGGRAHRAELPLVFRQARGHQPGRPRRASRPGCRAPGRGNRAGARRPWRTPRTPGAAARPPGTRSMSRRRAARRGRGRPRLPVPLAAGSIAARHHVQRLGDGPQARVRLPGHREGLAGPLRHVRLVAEQQRQDAERHRQAAARSPASSASHQ